MKTIKFTLLVVISLTTCFILNACGNGNKQESATSSSSKFTQTTKSSEKSEKSSTKEKATANSSSQDSKASQKEDTPPSSEADQSKDSTNQQSNFNFDELAQGNFASLAGTWQNDQGDKLVIYNNGTTNKDGAILLKEIRDGLYIG